MNREEAQTLFHANRLHPACPRADNIIGNHTHAKVSPFVRMPDGNLWRAYICNCGERFVATVEAKP